jgi:putative proteasome-type protease
LAPARICASCDYLFEAAANVGRLSVAVQKENEESLWQTGASGGAMFLLAGQIGNEPHGLYLIYPHCKVIKATPEKPLICGLPLRAGRGPGGQPEHGPPDQSRSR